MAASLLVLTSIIAQDDEPPPEEETVVPEIGYTTFSSPHFQPIVYHDGLVYVTNTPSDTLDIIDAERGVLVDSIAVGIDPVALAVKPDGSELWVSNHISDTISVIDLDGESDYHHQVIATIQDVDESGFFTRFDEPVGIAFANDEKAYVALSRENQVAVIDVANREVVDHLKINAQDPRGLIVQGSRLYVIPFESGNTTQLSGCNPGEIDGDMCTYDAVEHTHTNNNVLSLHIDVDIVRNPKVPDRDLFVFDTGTDALLGTVEGLGTLLYGVAVGGYRDVYIAQTEARNDANGKAGTLKHGLLEMENRAFLNQITKVNCAAFPCRAPEFYDLEPLPPEHPEPDMALATPYAVAVARNNRTMYTVAAGSDKLAVIDIQSQEVLGRTDVGAVPRGLSLEYDDYRNVRNGWVLNAVDNTVSKVNVTDPAEPVVEATITLEDPTPEIIKKGRIAFNDADASSTGTFSCESCHPDNNMDQLVWILTTPICDHPGCTQIPPRLTMPVRGLQDTAPYHWDGIPGDPYGGVNTASLWDEVEPNCELDDPLSCTRHLVDGSLATTMCTVGDCPLNEEEKEGALDAETRDALAQYILSVPFPPAPTRPFDNELSHSAQTGFFEFNYLNDSGLTTGAQACGACHKAPFLTTTNTPSARDTNANSGSFNGMDAPTWRGAYDRWQITPQARTNVIDLLERNGMDLEGDLPEQEIWFHGGARTQANWDMVLEFGTGFSGAYARQATLSSETVEDELTGRIIDALEEGNRDGAIKLRASGLSRVEEELMPIELKLVDDTYIDVTTEEAFGTRSELFELAESGDLLLTFTGKIGHATTDVAAQPGIWPYWQIGERVYEGIVEQSPTVEISFVNDNATLDIKGRHIQPGASVFLNGRRVDGSVSCVGGELPSCDNEEITVTFAEVPPEYGLNFLQIKNPDGLLSNDMNFWSEQTERPALEGSLIVSGGDFNRFEWPLQRFWNTVELDGNDISYRWGSGHIRGTISQVNTAQPWRLQISHTVSVVEGQQYTVCYRAKASANRRIEFYLDTNMHQWQNLSGRFDANLTTRWQNFQHTFTVDRTDITARVAWDLAQERPFVDIDDIGLFEGNQCGGASSS